ncbi:MAG: helix-hairpin-helix domain-containing protein [Planctomycetaceae bacterium]|jgi:competence protein ComEA|nr:helix-hairpin-helix domain-containing protein [Planctomycetaceae bacterium]
MRFLLRGQDQLVMMIFVVFFFVFIFSSSVSQTEWQSERKKEYQFQVDINTATVEELQTLPGIGGKLAEGIAEYRKTKGPFNDHYEIMNVKGIGVKKLNTVKPYLRDFP